MLVKKIIKVLLVLLGGVFIACQGFGLEVKAAQLSAVALFILAILYCKWTENKTKYFLAFIVLFVAGDLIGVYSYYNPMSAESEVDYLYFVANTLYMVAYLSLIVKILVGFNIRSVFSQFTIPIIILLIMDVFCVILVSGTTESEFTLYEYILEYTYNIVVMALLSVALINYMYRNDNKSMLFLIATICILFSEIIQSAYYYVLDDNNLSFIFSFFSVLAFILLYIQSQLEFTGPEPEYIDEQLEI